MELLPSVDRNWLTTTKFPVIISEAALSLILPPPKGTTRPPLGQMGGVLTPSTAMGMVLVERLRQSGKVVMQSEVLGGEGKRGESRKNV